MASLSFRDRFFSPPVAKAVTSPSGILSLGAGAAVGILATIGSAGLLLPVAGAIVGGAVGYGGRLAVALPKKGTGERIRPSAVSEPWRGQVEDAIEARTRFDQAVKSFRAGPMRDAMAETAERVEQAVTECWRVAQQGQIVAQARSRIDDRQINWELQRASYEASGDRSNETRERTITALQSQRDTAARMDAIVNSAKDQLSLLNARLDESVTRAIELSVSNRLSDATSLGDDVGGIVGDLEALRRAIEDVDQVPPDPAPVVEPRPDMRPAPPSPSAEPGQTAPGQ